MSRHRPQLLTIAAILLASFSASCSQKPAEAPAAPPDTRAADEAAIRAADAGFPKAAAAKDLDRCMSYYADDAVMFLPGSPALVGKDNIRKVIQGLVSAPNMQVNINVANVTVARSGDVAFDRGTVQETTVGKNGKPVTQTSEYALTWKKASDGSWKIVADTSANEK